MGHAHSTYIPAAGHHALLPLYDPLVRLLGGHRARSVLLDQAALGSARRILDIGCGTGSLAVLAKRRHPRLEVIGVDLDRRALARAWQKAIREGLNMQFDPGFAGALPYPDGFFDRVLSSFMFHHLNGEEKAWALAEVRRVLAPGGTFHMLDFERPAHGETGRLARCLHSSRRLRNNDADRVLALMRAAGLGDAELTQRGGMAFWRIAYYRASEGGAFVEKPLA